MKKEEIENINKLLPYIVEGKSTYYKVEYYDILINQYIDGQIEIDDVIIVPFYITEKITYEIYDYELYIHLTEEPNVENYFLIKTGMKSIENIKKEILLKLRKCSFEIKPNNKDEFIDVLKNYFIFLIGNDDIRDRLKTYQYSINNLYFQIY